MNKCKIYCSNYNCCRNSCYQGEAEQNSSGDGYFLVCSCARYVDVPMKIVNVGGITTEEFQADAIALLDGMAQTLCSISRTLENCCGQAENGCSCGCNGFNAYDSSNTCPYSNVNGSYGCNRCGRCR